MAQALGNIAPVTGANLATFLIQHRARIDALMNAQLGGAAPGAASAEAELLRRFRSCAPAALASGRPAEPALEGLRVHDRRASALHDGWIDAGSIELAGEDLDDIAGLIRKSGAGSGPSLPR